MEHTIEKKDIEEAVFSITSSGQMCLDDGTDIKLCDWNLLVDFDDQSEPTKQFLYDVLVKK